MKYQKKPLAAILRSPKTVFTFKDIALLWQATDKKTAIAGINYYVKTGQLIRLRRGIYAKDKNYNQLELGTRIFTPAYVSFETILGRNGLTFQYYSRIFLASYLTRELTINRQIFAYRKIKDSLLTNPVGIEHQQELSLATKERAFLDTLYLNGDYYFDNLDPLDWDKVFEILPIYNNRRMAKKVADQYHDFKHR